MSKIKVVAREHLKIPMLHNPHEYIEAQPVEVEASNMYYRRLILEGDLIVVKATKKQQNEEQKA